MWFLEALWKQREDCFLLEHTCHFQMPNLSLWVQFLPLTATLFKCSINMKHGRVRCWGYVCTSAKVKLNMIFFSKLRNFSKYNPSWQITTYKAAIYSSPIFLISSFDVALQILFLISSFDVALQIEIHHFTGNYHWRFNRFNLNKFISTFVPETTKVYFNIFITF